MRKYRIGDSVMVKNFSLGELSVGKMGPLWLGPYKINQIMDNNVYILSDEKYRLPSPVHANNLKMHQLRPRDNWLYRKWAINNLPQRIEDQGEDKEVLDPSLIIRKRQRT